MNFESQDNRYVRATRSLSNTLRSAVNKNRLRSLSALRDYRGKSIKQEKTRSQKVSFAGDLHAFQTLNALLNKKSLQNKRDTFQQFKNRLQIKAIGPFVQMIEKVLKLTAIRKLGKAKVKQDKEVLLPLPTTIHDYIDDFTVMSKEIRKVQVTYTPEKQLGPQHSKTSSAPRFHYRYDSLSNNTTVEQTPQQYKSPLRPRLSPKSSQRQKKSISAEIEYRGRPETDLDSQRVTPSQAYDHQENSESVEKMRDFHKRLYSDLSWQGMSEISQRSTNIPSSQNSMTPTPGLSLSSSSQSILSKYMNISQGSTQMDGNSAKIIQRQNMSALRMRMKASSSQAFLKKYNL